MKKKEYSACALEFYRVLDVIIIIVIIIASFLMATLIYSGRLTYLVLLFRNREQILPIPILLAFVLNSDFL